MTFKERTEFVGHLNKLALILELDVTYSVGFTEEDQSGMPNMSYCKELQTISFAWLPDFCSYSSQTLRDYVEMAKKKFGDCGVESKISKMIVESKISKMIDEAEDFYLALKI